MQRKKEFYENLLKQDHGNIKIIKLLRTEQGKGKIWLCQCKCGNEFEATTSMLSFRDIKECPSCGKERNKNQSIAQLTTHGKSKTKLYAIYHSMISRCNYVGDTNYSAYGGRGIKICDEWKINFLSFYEWALNNGYKETLSIERLDCNGDYEPSNCTWIPLSQQALNRRSTRHIKVNGETKTLSQWAKVVGVSHTAIINAGKRGISAETYIQRKLGRTVGTDWNVIAPTTKIYIEGVGERVVEDTGSGIQGNHIDVYVDSHDEALQLGRATRKVYTVE